eukprot:m.396994 g.396994  ORF g.396994 m.396994 type:complete len:177 (-) comp21118_c0_seq6:173-703(-)
MRFCRVTEGDHGVPPQSLSSTPPSHSPTKRDNRSVSNPAVVDGASAAAVAASPSRKSSWLRRKFSRSNMESSSPSIARASAQPRTLRFTFSRTNTSNKHPKLILFELERVLALHGITYQQQEAFLLVCVQGSLQFEMEVCKLPRLSLHGIKHRRISGESLGYKNVCTKILGDMQLD